MTSVELFTRIAIPALWAAWGTYWIVAARDVKKTRWQEPTGAGLRHGLPLLLCGVLFTVPYGLTARFVPAGPTLPLIGTVVVAGGLGFAAWARAHLGRNWSGHVVVKEGHALIRTGPYRLVRHPIYTGLLTALIGLAVAIGEWRGVLAVGFAALGILLRIRGEETQMRRIFPDYAQYRRETKALIPGVF